MSRRKFGLLSVWVMVTAMWSGAAFAESRAEFVDSLGGFGSGGLPDGWYGFAAEGASFEYRQTKDGPDGADALVIEGQGQYGGAAGTHVALNRDRRYAASVMLKIESGDPGAAAGVKVDYYDGSGQYIADTNVMVPLGAEGWQTVSVLDKASEYPDAAEVAITLIVNGKIEAGFSKPMLHSRENDKENLLPNGGVENVGPGGAAANWTVGHDENGKASIVAEEVAGADGRLALKLTTEGVQWANADATGMPMEVDPDARYLLTGRAKAGKGNVQLVVVYLDKDHMYLNHVTSDPAGAEWSDLRVRIYLDEHPNVTHMVVGAFGSGDAEGWFDQLKLVKQ